MPVNLSNGEPFTLTGPTGTGLTAQQITPIPPPNEIWQPFQVAATGFITATNDSVLQVGQKLFALMVTNPGERVMKPGYGVGAQKYVFEGDLDNIAMRLTADLTGQVNLWLPQLLIQDVTPFLTGLPDGFLQVNVSFQVPSNPIVHTVTMDFQGQLVTV